MTDALHRGFLILEYRE